METFSGQANRVLATYMLSRPTPVPRLELAFAQMVVDNFSRLLINSGVNAHTMRANTHTWKSKANNVLRIEVNLHSNGGGKPISPLIKHGISNVLAIKANMTHIWLAKANTCTKRTKSNNMHAIRVSHHPSND